MFSFLFASDAFLSANLSLQQCNSNNGTYLFMLFFFYIFLSFFSHLLFFPLPVFFLFSLFFSVFWHSFEKIGQSIISSARLFFFSFLFFSVFGTHLKNTGQGLISIWKTVTIYTTSFWKGSLNSGDIERN